MTKNKPGLVKTGIDDLTYKINSLAMQVQNELKTGHPEKFYQRRLAELCLEEGLQAEIEKRVEVWIGEDLVGYLFLDLWVEDSLVVECKAFDHDLTESEVGQVLTYLVATGASVGMLYNFGKKSLEFKRILPPIQVQEWQQYLFRCMWTTPGTILPQLNSEEARKPITFSIVSSKPPKVSLNSSDHVQLSNSGKIEKSADIRLSVLESVDQSDYAASGVNIDAGNRAVELMRPGSALSAACTMQVRFSPCSIPSWWPPLTASEPK
jgi:GxxExxY protein